MVPAIIRLLNWWRAGRLKTSAPHGEAAPGDKLSVASTTGTPSPSAAEPLEDAGRDAGGTTMPEVQVAQTGDGIGESVPACAADAGIAFRELRRRLQGAGQWRPEWERQGIERFWAALACAGEVDDEEGRPESAQAWFARFLESLPAAVELREIAGRSGGVSKDAFSDCGPGAAQHWPAMTSGGAIDGRSLALHEAALAVMAARPGMEYREALRRCARGVR